MASCLFRTELEPLPAAVLEKLPGPAWSPFDLKRMARRPVLLEGLRHEDAKAEQRRLLAEGYVVEAVSDGWLKLPKHRVCRRALVEADALVVPDVFGGEQRIAWDAVRVVALGIVPAIERVAVEETDVEVCGDIDGGLATETKTVMRGRRSERLQMMVATAAPVRRYVINPEDFDFSALGDRVQIRARDNLVRWLRSLVAHAPRLTLDPAAQAFVETGRPQRYDTLNAMDRSLAWHLWRHHGPGAALDGETDVRTKPFVDDENDMSFTERARARSADRVIASFAEDQRQCEAQQRPQKTVSVVFFAAIVALGATYELVPDDLSLPAVGMAFLALLTLGIGVGWYFTLRNMSG